MKRFIFCLALALPPVLAFGGGVTNPGGGTPTSILNPTSGATASANNDGTISITPAGGSAVNVVNSDLYTPKRVDFSTNASPTLSASGHAALNFDGTNFSLSLGGGAFSPLLINGANPGAIALTAGGSNQNITLTPSGTGTVNVGGSATNTGFYTDATLPNGVTFKQSTPSLYFGQGVFRLVGNGVIAWGNQTNTFASAVDDLSLLRDAANTLAQRNGTAAQTSRLYASYTGTADYSRYSLTAGLTGLTIAAENAGATGTANPNQNITLTPSGTGSAVIAVNASAASQLSFAGGGTFYSQYNSFVFKSPSGNGGMNFVGAGETPGGGSPYISGVNSGGLTLGTGTSSGNYLKLFNSGGLYLGTSPSDPGAGNLQLSGTFIVADDKFIGESSTLGLAFKSYNPSANLTINGTSNYVFGATSLQITHAGSAATLAVDAANTLAQRNGTNAQTFRLYNTYTDASNYERGVMNWSANTLRIGTENLGTGSARSIDFITGGSTRMTVGSNGVVSMGNLQITSGMAGNFIFSADNTYDIGSSGANRPRNVYVAGQGTLGGVITNSGNGLFLALDAGINTGARIQSFVDGNIRLSNNASSSFGLLQFGGTTSSFPALKRNGNKISAVTADDSAMATVFANQFNSANDFASFSGSATKAQLEADTGSVRVLIMGSGSSGLRMAAGYSVGWSSNAAGSGDAYTSQDTGLARSAAATVKVTDGSTGTGNLWLASLYPTNGDATNYVRGNLSASTTAVTLAAESAGTGSANVDVVLTPKGSGALLLPAGTVGSPSLRFGGDTTTGFYRSAANAVTFDYGGNPVVKLEDGITLYSTFGLRWGPGTALSTPDTGLFRSAAATVKVTDGSTGYGFVEDLYRRKGTGSPEAVVAAPVGAVYHRTDGGTGTAFYVKETGTTTSSGWVAK